MTAWLGLLTEKHLLSGHIRMIILRERISWINLAGKIREQLGNGFNILRIINAPPEYKKREDISSASGNYFNFLRIGNKIFIPQYGIQEDRNAIKAFKKFIPCC